MTGYLVFGADPAVTQSCQTHNLYHPTYPRDAQHCSACHVAGFGVIPDQAKAVATTIDAGKIDSGTGTGRCGRTSSTIRCRAPRRPPARAATATTDARGHAYQNGWTPQTFPNGRQTILDTK